VRGFFGNKGVVRLGVIEMIRGNCNGEATGGDVVDDRGRGMLTGSGVSSIGIGSLYCSIDEYSHRCDPQGTRGSGGDGTLGTTGGNSMTSLGRDDDGWMNGQMTGIGPTGGSGAVAGADDGASGMMTDPPPVPKGVGLGTNIGDGDLPLIILLQLLRRVRSPSRNV